MKFLDTLSTNTGKDSFLKTRIYSLNLPKKIKNILSHNNILTVRRLLSDNNLKLEIDEEVLIKNSLITLCSDINIQTQKIKKTNFENEHEVIMETPVPAGVDEDKMMGSFAAYFSIKKDILFGQTRKKEVVRMRDIIVYILRKYGELSFPVIGRLIGGRDHTTIIHSFKKIKDELSDIENFETEFSSLILASKSISKKYASARQSTLSSFIKSKVYKNRDNQPVQISGRNNNILSFYRQGLSLEKIGKLIGVTRERIRQIIIHTIKQIAFNESILRGTKIDYNRLLREEKTTRSLVIQANKPIKISKLSRKEYSWSRSYDSCVACGTNVIPHFKKGLCNDCGNKSISGKAREDMIISHNNACDLCGLMRGEAIKKYDRDLYLSRKDQTVLCKNCFLDITGKTLASTKKNKWRFFYKQDS